MGVLSWDYLDSEDFGQVRQCLVDRPGPVYLKHLHRSNNQYISLCKVHKTDLFS